MRQAMFLYAVALVAANLTVAAFGPKVAIVNAFLFIGLDLTLRDALHGRLTALQMAALITGTGVATYLLNPAAGTIAVASAVAFTCAALADWTAFSLIRASWLTRADCSNVVGAAVDSIVFPTIAFGGFSPEITALQFLAKTLGGAMWAWALQRRLA